MNNNTSDNENTDDEDDDTQARDIQEDKKIDENISEYSTFYGYPIRKAYRGEKIKAGLRVVRGAGRVIGTVVDILEGGNINVQWDTKEEECLKEGADNQSPFLLLDNAQTGVQHSHVICQGCYQYPLKGIRWSCLTCENYYIYDLCTDCYMDDKHDLSHTFKRITSANLKSVKMTPRDQLDCTRAVGMRLGSAVNLRTNRDKKGQITEFVEKTVDIKKFRCDAKVKWSKKSIRRHCVGRNGRCVLKYTTEANGHKYYENHLPIVTWENVNRGVRVVRGPNFECIGKPGIVLDGGPGNVGTVCYALEHEIGVQWDNGNTAKYIPSEDCLRLFDNGPSGVEHDGYFCFSCSQEKGNIRGIRWKCSECDNLNLCTLCYMSDKHDVRHTFQRFVEPQMCGFMTKSRDDSRSSIRESKGIFKGAKVFFTDEKEGEQEGIVKEICDFTENIVYTEVKVTWEDKTTTPNRIMELEYEKDGDISYYHDHLPVLKEDYHDYFEVDFRFDSGLTKEIEVNVCHSIQKEQKLGFKPVLYLVFANARGDENKDNMALMEEVIEFARKTKLPCHILGQRLLFHSGSCETVVINTPKKEIVEELVKKGFRKFERAENISKTEDEIVYFKQMAENVLGEVVLPVIISFSNGGMTKEVWKISLRHEIPIIRLKKHNLDVSILRNIEFRDSWWMTTEYQTLKNPWLVKKSKSKTYGVYLKELDDPYEIALISEIHSDFPDGLDALVCCLLIGLVKVEHSCGPDILGKNTEVYPNALSMFLLKEGKWRIPKEHIQESFSHKSIEYIYEEEITSHIKKGLWSHLKQMTNMAYKPPNYEGVVDIRLKVSDSELYGLIFFALLQKQYYAGAKQLLEQGCIRIHYILIGCVILEDAVNNLRTTPFLKDELQQLKNSFTKRAIRITSCIYDADKKKEDDAFKRKKNKVKNSKDDPEHKEDKELGDYINHAGRLLLNHGYIDDAIKTKNTMFLDNSTVKNILNKMWYGTEELNFQTMLCFVVLAVVHIVVLPLLMINMEARPLLWFYKKYSIPFMKVFMHMLGLLTLLIAYSYMLLFNYSYDGMEYTDYFIIVWMASFFVDESKQLFVAIVRQKWGNYARNWWNRLDWLSMIVYASGMLLKLGEGYHFRNASRVVLVAAFILFCIRFLNVCCISSILGPKLIMIRKMFDDTFAFMLIMTVIMMCYNISCYALLYPNSEFSWIQMEKIIQRGYWMLFGELNLDGDTLTEPDCTFNITIYENGASLRCPTQIGLYLTPYLKAFYGLIAVILLLNLLIAMYSHTFDQVQQESEIYWSQLQTDFLEEYSIKTVFPIHLQLFVVPATIIHAFFWYCLHGTCRCGIFLTKCCKGRKHNDLEPMFVRVFLFNTKFDLKLETTEKAEGNGVLHAKGEIDFIAEDRITTLHKQLNTIGRYQGTQNDKNEEIMNRLQTMDDNLKEICKLVRKSDENKTELLKENKLVEDSVYEYEEPNGETEKSD